MEIEVKVVILSKVTEVDGSTVATIGNLVKVPKTEILEVHGLFVPRIIAECCNADTLDGIAIVAT